MAEERKSKNAGFSIDTGDVKVTIPNASSQSKDDNSNDYINQVLENAKDSIAEAEIAKAAMDETKKELETNNGEQDAAAVVNEDEYSSMGCRMFVGKEPENNEDKPKLRKLAKFEKLIICSLIMVSLIQLISIFAVPALACLVISAVCLILIVALSYSCKQYSMLFVSILLIAIPVAILMTGETHGLIKDDLSSKSILRLNYLNSNTHEAADYGEMTDEEIVQRFAGKFIYYYKYTCKDCVAVNSQLEAIVKSQDYEMIPVETRSDLGKQLLTAFPVNEVPSGLVISEDGTGITRILYAVENGETVFQTDELLSLFDKIDEIQALNERLLQ